MQLFVMSALNFYHKKTKNKKTDKEANAGTIVNWWTKYEIFDHDNKDSNYWKLVEQIHEERKKLKPKQRENRFLARRIPYKEFIDLLKEQDKLEQKAKPKFTEDLAEI